MPEPPTPRTWRQTGRLLTQGILGLAMLAALVVYVDVDAILNALRHAHPGWIGIAAVLALPNVLLDTWSWGAVVRPALDADDAAVRFSHGSLLRSTLAGYAAGFFTPARVGEFAGRALTLNNTDAWTVSLTVVVQRMADMLVAVGIGLSAMIWARSTGILSGVWDPAVGIGAAVVLVFGAVLARPGVVDRWLRRLAPSATALHNRTALLHRLDESVRLRLLSGSLARYIIYAGQMAILVRAFAPTAEWTNLAAGAGLMYYFKYLIPSLTLLDVGIREGAAVLTYRWMAIPEAAAINAALLIFLINVVLPAIVGAAFLQQIRNRFGSRIPSTTDTTPSRPS